MTTQSTQTPPTGFWKIRHLLIALGAVVLIVMLMLRSCGSDEPQEKAAKHEENLPRQAVVVQIPASQWPQQQPPVQPPAPQQPGYGYIPQQPGYGYAPQQPGYGYAPQQQPQAPAVNGSNPWAVQAPQGYNYGQQDSAQWGQPQQRAPQYVPQPPSGVSRYRPLDEDTSSRAAPRPAPQPPPVPSYRPAAPYDRLSGSSFGEGAQTYPYGGAYPGYYGSGAYGVPVTPYVPVYPGVVPGAGWPGVW